MSGVIDRICRKCQASTGHPCMEKKRDGHRNIENFHEERVKDWLESEYPQLIAQPPELTKVRIPYLSEGEPYFILRGQDRSAAQLVQMWISLNQPAPGRKGAPLEKLKHANEILEAMRAWPHKKQAD